jgi:hypothetical protein
MTVAARIRRHTPCRPPWVFAKLFQAALAHVKTWNARCYIDINNRLSVTSALNQQLPLFATLGFESHVLKCCESVKKGRPRPVESAAVVDELTPVARSRQTNVVNLRMLSAKLVAGTGGDSTLLFFRPLRTGRNPYPASIAERVEQDSFNLENCSLAHGSVSSERRMIRHVKILHGGIWSLGPNESICVTNLRCCAIK